MSNPAQLLLEINDIYPLVHNEEENAEQRKMYFRLIKHYLLQALICFYAGLPEIVS